MPLTLRWGTVTAVTQRLEELIRCQVDESPCVAYPRQTGPVEVGDTVLINTQARDLGLGSGGFDVVYANLTRGLGLQPSADAHVMTLPYTPGQARCGVRGGARAARRRARRDARRLRRPAQPARSRRWRGSGRASGSPTRSWVVGRCPWRFGHRAAAEDAAPPRDGRSPLLPASTATCRRSRSPLRSPGRRRRSSTSSSAGSARASWGRAPCSATAAWPSRRPRTPPRRSGGRAIVVARYSGADARERHRGVSHHTRSALRLVLGAYEIACPAGSTASRIWGRSSRCRSTGGRRRCANLPLDHMGRGPADDPGFFAAAFAAGRHARSLVA